jgi:hypothetical protein
MNCYYYVLTSTSTSMVLYARVIARPHRCSSSSLPVIVLGFVVARHRHPRFRLVVVLSSLLIETSRSA